QQGGTGGRADPAEVPGFGDRSEVGTVPADRAQTDAGEHDRQPARTGGRQEREERRGQKRADLQDAAAVGLPPVGQPAPGGTTGEPAGEQQRGGGAGGGGGGPAIVDEIDREQREGRALRAGHQEAEGEGQR